MPSTDPSRALAIFLGASTFPRSPQLLQGRFFYNSAADVMEYMTDAKGMQLPRENLLWLFDDSRSAPDQLVEIADFLCKRKLELKSAGSEPTDLFIYYVGHGSFTRGGDQAYCLAVRNTNAINEGATSMRAGELANVVKENAAFMKRYLIFDCCFAGSAAREFQSGALTAAKVQIKKEFPGSGTALMCAANSEQPAKSPEGLGRTMFSTALMHAFRAGHGAFGPQLSFSELGDIVRDYLRSNFPNDFVRPEVHSPDQHEGDIAGIPLFPNPGYALSRPPQKRVAAASAEPRVEATPAMPEVPPRRPPMAVERPAARPAETRTAEPVKPKPKPEREEQKREEKEFEEKRRASQDAAAERVLERIKRDRAKQQERIRLAKQKEAEERERETVQPQVTAVPSFGMSKQNPAAQPTAASTSARPSLAWLVLMVVPLANVVGYFMGWLLAYQASQGTEFFRNVWVLVILWSVLGFFIGFFTPPVLEGAFERNLKHSVWFMLPGYLGGSVFHVLPSAIDSMSTAASVSVLLFLVGALSGLADKPNPPA